MSLNLEKLKATFIFLLPAIKYNLYFKWFICICTSNPPIKCWVRSPIYKFRYLIFPLEGESWLIRTCCSRRAGNNKLQVHFMTHCTWADHSFLSLLLNSFGDRINGWVPPARGLFIGPFTCDIFLSRTLPGATLQLRYYDTVRLSDWLQQPMAAI